MSGGWSEKNAPDGASSGRNFLTIKVWVTRGQSCQWVGSAQTDVREITFLPKLTFMNRADFPRHGSPGQGVAWYAKGH